MVPVSMMNGGRKNKNVPSEKYVNFVPLKIWRESGPEQKELEKLFRNKTIDDMDTPSVVRSKYPIFREFSLRVFSNHFRQTKAKLGCYCE